MLRSALVLPLAALPSSLECEGHEGSVKPGVTYLYTYYDKQGRLVINNLPPAYHESAGWY